MINPVSRVYPSSNPKNNQSNKEANVRFSEHLRKAKAQAKEAKEQ